MSFSNDDLRSARSGKFSLSLAALVSAFALTALPAAAQGANGSSSSSSSGAAGSGGSSKKAGGESGIARTDTKMMHELAETNNAEIETGKLVLDKSQMSSTMAKK
jgi:predicted outer membrane protein